MANRQQRIDEVLGTGQELIDSCHFATDQIEEWCHKLTEAWEHLLEKCTERRDTLGDAVESHMVLSYHKTTITEAISRNVDSDKN